MDTNLLQKIAKQLVTPGKGILASDESIGSADKTLQKIGVEPNVENRRRYRELFIGTPGIGNYLSGIILSEETFEQTDSNNILFRDILKKEEVLVGVKVDKGTYDIPGFPKEKFTLGLDGLGDKMERIFSLGGNFAKWRSIELIDANLPSEEAIHINAEIHALYAGICQTKNIVPIVEPEVLIDGNHNIQQSYETTSSVLKLTFEVLKKYKVFLPGMVLKTSMVVPGKESVQKATNQEVAEATINCLKESVPSEVGGIVFLSGGQSAEDATNHLNEIGKVANLPWELAFSFLRAIEGPPAEIWAGKDENVVKARALFEEILTRNTLADRGLLENK